MDVVIVDREYKTKINSTISSRWKKNASSSIEDGSTNTMVTIEPAKQISVVKGTVRKKLLIKLKF